MQKNRTLCLGLFLVCTWGWSQTFSQKKLEGKVQSADGDVAATHVLNTTTGKATITDIDGYFSIPVSLHDTVLFSAVQYKKKEIVITLSLLESKSVRITLEEALTELDEVIVRPYNLSGDLGLDAKSLQAKRVVTASTLGLPNAYVRVPTQSERQLYEATSGGGLIPLNPILNGISGRTKMLKQQVARDAKYARTDRVKAFYADSLFVKDLKIPLLKIDDFMYFCEVDPYFQTLVDTHDQLRIWEYMRKKSVAYRKNNELD
jgi:hypothetical protein